MTVCRYSSGHEYIVVNLSIVVRSMTDSIPREIEPRPIARSIVDRIKEEQKLCRSRYRDCSAVERVACLKGAADRRSYFIPDSRVKMPKRDLPQVQRNRWNGNMTLLQWKRPRSSVALSLTQMSRRDFLLQGSLIGSYAPSHPS